MKSKYPVSKICDKLEVSRGGYYKYVKNKGKQKRVSNKDKELKEYITIVYNEHQKNFGYRKVHGELRNEHNLPVGEKVVRRLMRELGLKSQTRKKKSKSVNGNKVTAAGYIYQNLLKRDFSITKISEKWATDVTEFPIGDKKLYLSALLDLHDNFVLGYHINYLKFTTSNW
ncbi:IS3 family transposase [Bacillus fonticola]|uniref:IS3 family transposase n=1 Tax=Bacillus fonticola TaxID=2728853 RepID=UPI0014741B7D|nr:IS3 family transposase [Bacillus fonticola]